MFTETFKVVTDSQEWLAYVRIEWETGVMSLTQQNKSNTVHDGTFSAH